MQLTIKCLFLIKKTVLNTCTNSWFWQPFYVISIRGVQRINVILDKWIRKLISLLILLLHWRIEVTTQEWVTRYDWTCNQRPKNNIERVAAEWIRRRTSDYWEKNLKKHSEYAITHVILWSMAVTLILQHGI